jgi:cytochrome P450
LSANIIHPDDYVRGYPHEVWTYLRVHDPVHWWDRTGGVPFWAITKHADIVEISKQPEVFRSGVRFGVRHRPEHLDPDPLPLTLIDMDPPRHGVWRQLVSKRFTPNAIRRFHPDIHRIGKQIVDELLARGQTGEIDFVEHVSAPLPIAVIAWMLGVPEKDWRLLFDWTNRTIGAGDPEYRREGESPREAAEGAQRELATYFTDLIETKRRHPADDLVTVLATVQVDGRPLPLPELLSWCYLIVLAGNETTRNATTGGIAAFAEQMDQLRRFQADPGLLKPAVEEVLRWTSPVIHMARTATRAYELRDKKIARADTLVMFYPSANRDEEVFDDPFAFRIVRQPNRHLAFGIGEHFCLGAHLARLEIQVAYRYLLPRLDEIELLGPPERLRANQVGGIKHLRLRYRLKAPA